MFQRILFIWAIRHPASGYVQGINDLVIPFFVVFLSDVIPQGELCIPFVVFLSDVIPQGELCIPFVVFLSGGIPQGELCIPFVVFFSDVLPQGESYGIVIFTTFLVICYFHLIAEHAISSSAHFESQQKDLLLLLPLTTT